MNSAAVAVAAPGSATQRQARDARWRPAAPATADWTHVRAVGVGRSEMRVSTAHVFWPLAAGECHGYPDLVELRAQVARTLGRNRDGRALASCSLLRRFWCSAAGFWSGGLHSPAWTFTGGLMLIIVCLLGAAYAMNAWNRAMFDGLQNRDVDTVGKLSILYLVILAAIVLFSIF